MILVNSDDVIHQCVEISGVVSFVVTAESAVFSEEMMMLVEEGFPKGLARGLLRKNGGNVEVVRRELVMRKKVSELNDQGFPRGKCRKLLVKNGGDVEATRRELGGNSEGTGNIQDLVNEGMPRKDAVRLMKKFKGDVTLAREHYLKIQEDDVQYQEIADELFAQGFKPRARVMRLLNKFNGDVEKVKEEITTTRKRPSNHENTPRDHGSLKRKRNDDVKQSDENEIPFAEVRTIYLDGNNMLYIETEMRNLAIKNRNKLKAEKMLANLALAFTQRSTEDLNLKLMFDTTSLHGYTDTNFEILCAREMGFKIADDALVHISQENPEIRDSTVFVTSDRELIERLKALGSFAMKPKSFLFKIKDLIGQSDYEAILQQQMSILDE